MTARDTVSRLHVELPAGPRVPLLHKLVHHACISAGIDGTARMLIQPREMRPGAWRIQTGRWLVTSIEVHTR